MFWLRQIRCRLALRLRDAMGGCVVDAALRKPSWAADRNAGGATRPARGGLVPAGAE